MTMILNNPRERGRFLRFAVVGVIGAVVDFGVANLLVALFHAPLWLAGTVSFIAAVISNFTWNRFWTYPDSRSKPVVRQLLEFTVVSVVGLGIRVPVLAFMEPPVLRLTRQLPLPVSPITPELLAKNITLAIAVIIVMFWNFFANRFWTYGDVE
ncbi:MAG: GtrA family protein [Chloroflexi bacterium]|jgi:putative flippase GtrA|nr:GtrA family protein [Chloroflexota bacterium]